MLISYVFYLGDGAGNMLTHFHKYFCSNREKDVNPGSEFDKPLADPGHALTSVQLTSSHRDYYVPFFMSGIDVAVRLDHLFKWIAAIDERFDLPCFDPLFDEH